MKSKEKEGCQDQNASFQVVVNPYSVAKWNGITGPETQEETQIRLKTMQEAVERSKAIDIMLQETKKQMERRTRGVKILLLGQSESGKSSVLKNFQLAFAPKHFESERYIWRIVIQLNIIGTIKTILEALTDEFEPSGFPMTPTNPSSNSPLKHFEGCGSDYRHYSLLNRIYSRSLHLNLQTRGTWKYARDGLESIVTINLRQEHDPTSVLVGQREDIIALWENPETQEVLKRRRPNLGNQSGFFMNDISRILKADYVPMDQDIIRARIRTMGVEEHHFVAEKVGSGLNTDFYITDVGGARSQRATWAPFFDDVQAIVFLAPLAFNQTLEEDPRVNRLEDSLYLWKDICSNKLLARANVILFFNKKDVLSATLASGVKVKRWVPTYGDLPNDIFTVTKYFKDKFRAYHKKCSPDSRPFLCHETSALDIKSMSVLLVGVRESILRQYLRQGDML